MQIMKLVSIFIWIYNCAICSVSVIAQTNELIDDWPLTTTDKTDVSGQLDIANTSFEAIPEKVSVPADCAQRQKNKLQPKYTPESRWQKCCSIGESLNLLSGDEQTEEMCDTAKVNFTPTVVSVALFDNCIEDLDERVELGIDIGNPCNTSLIYNSAEDQFIVLQDGSLLIMDEYANETYTVERNYCLDIDNISNVTYAIVCITSVDSNLRRSQVLTVAILMLISIPCLCIVSYLHLSLRRLRNVHGISLSAMSISLAMGYFLHSVVHIYSIDPAHIGYAVQFFILSYFCWFLMLCVNVLINIWYKIPYGKQSSKINGVITLAIYFIISFSIPMALVVCTVRKGLQGMPSYFIRGLTESIRESQRYFIPPVTTMLFVSFILMVISFFGFQRIKNRELISRNKNCKIYLSIAAEIDEERYEEVKKDAKCISLLLIITITLWLLEVVTFYSPEAEGYLLCMEIMNGLQGVFVLLIFLIVRRRRTIIMRWWFDRGSHNVENAEVEMTELNK